MADSANGARHGAARLVAIIIIVMLGGGVLLLLPTSTLLPRVTSPLHAEQAEAPAAPAEKDSGEAHQDEEQQQPQQNQVRGVARTSPLNGGEPDDEEIARLWRAYQEAPARINRTEDEGCGNGDSFEWALTWNTGGNNASVRSGELTFPSAVAYGTQANQTVHATVFKPASKDDDNNNSDAEAKPLPAVVLLHHLEDDQRVQRLIANFFALRGHLAVLLYFPHYGPRGAEGAPDDQEMMRALIGSDFPKVAQAIWDIHRLRDWLHAQDYVDNDNVSLMGVSLGGLMGSLSAGVDPGFTRYVFLLAGGDLARIIFNGSRETRWLKELVREEGLTEDDLRERVRAVDPCTFAYRIDGSRVMMVNTEEDEVIPRASTEALIEAIRGKPTVHWFPGNHTAVRHRFGQLLSLSHEFVTSAGGADEQGEEEDGDAGE